MKRLTSLQQKLLRDMIEDGGFTLKAMAACAGCGISTVTRMRLNMNVFGAIYSSTQFAGRQPSIYGAPTEADPQHVTFPNKKKLS